MKRKLINSLRLLLVAAGLCVGESAWGDIVETTVVNCDFENGETLFSATKDPGGAARVTVSNASEESAHYVNFANGSNASNGNAIATYDFNTLTSDASAVDIEFDAYLSSGSPNYHHIFTIGDASKREHTAKSINNTGAIFTFGMKRGKWNGSGSNVNYWSINNAYTTNSEENFSKWLHVKVYVDLVNKKVNYTIKNQAQTETINSGTDIAFLDATATACTQIDYNSCLNSGSGRVDNLVIKKYKDNSAVATTYTVKYQDTNGSTLKEDAVYDTYVGNVYSALESDMATFYNDGSTKKYVYKSGQNTETPASEIASENVITLVFDTYNKYDYSIKQKLGGNDATTLASGSKYEDETLTYYYPKCVKSGDDYYIINANGSEPLYGVTVSSSNKTPTLTYTLDEDIIYYAECETLYSGTYSADYFTEKSSKGASKAMNGDVFMKTSMGLAADGVFDVTISGGNRDTGHTTTANLKLINSSDQISEDNVISQYMSGGAWIGEMNASNVTIPAGSELYIVTDNTGGVSRYVFDYIIVRKSAVTYTVKYKCGGVEIKDADASRTAVWGTYASLTDADKVDVTYNGHLYRYESDDASSQQIVSGGTTVITATFRDLGAVTTITYALNVGTDAGTTIKSSATSTDASNIIGVDIDQTKAAGDGNGASDRTTKLPIKTGDNGETYDSPTNYVVFKYTVAAGKKFTLNYATIKVANVGSTSANKVKYKAELSDGTNTLSNTYLVTTQDGTVETFYVSNNSEVAFTGNVTLKLWAWTIDDTSNASAFRMGTPLEITGTLESLPEVNATISSTTGYATFSCTSPVNVDVEGLEAYIATAQNDGYITMQKVTGDVAANTGLVLKGNVGDYNLPIVASGTTYNTESDPKNYLFAISSNYNLGTPVNGTNYVLSVQSGKVVFAPIGATAAPVTAGHAALWIPAVGARMLEMSFADDETTGISQIENRRLDAENSVYNLNGQRVTKPSKGLYIVGGKKVILK